MLAYTYIKHGTFQMMEKPVPEIKDPRDAVVRVTLGSICTSVWGTERSVNESVG